MYERINSLSSLRYFLALDKAAYAEISEYSFVKKFFHLGHNMLGYWFLTQNRYLEYFYNIRNKCIIFYIIFQILNLRYMFLERKYGVLIPINVLGPGARFWHFGQGTIIINGRANIGKGCAISSNCVIGHANGGVPKIGDFVEISIDSKILGDINISDNCIIGAGSLVINSVERAGSVIAGVPAKIISTHTFLEHQLRKQHILEVERSLK